MPPCSTSTVPDCTGRLLNGRYKLTHMIGSGTFGVVYQAIDESIQADDDDARSVAIKVVSKSNKKLRDSSHLRLEIALHKRASLLPHVVTLRAALEDEQLSFLVMDLCRGGSLGQHIQKNGPFIDEQRLRTTFLGIVDAVCDLHGAGIYHRDLKPGNILLSKDGAEVFLGDFGLASRSECYNYLAGTRAFMPPELLHPKFNTRPSSAQSDIWALGIVLLSMLSGRVPWPTASPSEPAYADFVRDPRHLLDHFPISPGLNRILRRMLRVNPAIRMRLPDVRRAIAELDSLLREVPEAEADISDVGLCHGAGVVPDGAHRQTDGKPSGAAEDAFAGNKPATQGASQWEENKEMMRSTVQSEMDIVAARQARQEAIRQQHAQACAAAAALACSSSLDFSPNTAAKAARKSSAGSRGSSSGKSSTMAVTPDDSDVVIEKRDIGDRMREIVLRVRLKFRQR
ncbi:kinase-like protein [Ganoderma leucocontextum]|nr:kinase-like protein [Ganoderma leucocontextum]